MTIYSEDRSNIYTFISRGKAVFFTIICNALKQTRSRPKTEKFLLIYLVRVIFVTKFNPVF